MVSLITAPSSAERLKSQQEKEKAMLAYHLDNFYLPHIDSLVEADPQNAINYAKHLLRTDYPKNDNLYLRIGYGYFALDSFQLAIEYIEASITYGYSTYTNRDAIAYCYIQLKNYEKALEIYKDLANSNRSYNIVVGDVYLLKEDYKNATDYYSNYIEAKEASTLFPNKDVELQKLILRRDSVKNLIRN